MAHTKKHLIKTLSRDYEKVTITINIYTSGGTTHSAWLNVLNDAGEVTRTQVETRRGDTARKELITWARDYLDDLSEHNDLSFISTRRIERAIDAAGTLRVMLAELADKYEDADQSKSEAFETLRFQTNNALEMLQEEIS